MPAWRFHPRQLSPSIRGHRSHRRGHPALSQRPPALRRRWRGGGRRPNAGGGGEGGGYRAMGARLPRAGAGRAAQGHGGKGGGASRRLRRARCCGGTAQGPPAPSPPPCPPPGPHSPCCGGWCGLSRRLCAAGLGAELRLLQSPPQRSLMGGRGSMAPRPLIWVHLHAGRVYPLRGPREPGGVLLAAEEPRSVGPKAAPPSLPGERLGASVQVAGGSPGDQPPGVTGSAEPPARDAEQVEQLLTCSATSSPRDVGRPRVHPAL